jgi:hypothetical protein
MICLRAISTAILKEDVCTSRMLWQELGDLLSMSGSKVSNIKDSIELVYIIYITMDSQPTFLLTLTLCHCRLSYCQLTKPGTI